MKLFLLTVMFSFVLLAGCSSDENNNVTPTPPAGEVLLAEVPFDSVGSIGASTKSSTITSGTLNFTGRDSARISFYYSGENNSAAAPMKIYSGSDTIFSSTTLSPTPTEQFVSVTIPSPGINSTFYYKISTVISLPGFSYFKFRDLKIYKK